MLPRYARVVCVVVVFVLAGVVHPIVACGLTGPIALGFASTYSAPDGTTCTHRGVDVALAAGSTVEAPRAGTVRFAGRVPGPHGGSVLAVTLETADGNVTMLPLASLSVGAGEAVDPGEPVGSLAATGDPSSSAARLHLGLKRGGVYVDPVGLLAAPVTAAEPEPSEQPAVGTQPSVATRAAASAQVVVSPTTGAVPAGSASGAKAGSAAGQASSAELPAMAGSASAQGLPAGVSLSGGTEAEPAVGVGSPGIGSAIAARRAGASVSADGGVALTPGIIALVASVLSACCFLVPLVVTRRAISARVVKPPVSDRLGTLLQHL